MLRLRSFQIHPRHQIRQVPVDPDAGGIVDRAEAQDRPASVGAQLDVALVPAAGVKAGVMDAAPLGLRWKGDFDRPVPTGDVGWMEVDTLVVVGEAPRTVQG